MAIHRIVRAGHPVLSRPADPIEDPHAPEILRLIEDMIETMHEATGVGLAAPQIAVPLRLVVFYVPERRVTNDPEDTVSDIIALANPEIAFLGHEAEPGWEGCLSLPGLRGLVSRPRRITYRGIDPRSGPVERTVAGFHARVVQHECDHLDGILYPARMNDLGTLGYVEEVLAAQTATA